MRPTLALDSVGTVAIVTSSAGGACIFAGLAHQIVALSGFHMSLGAATAAASFPFQDLPDSLVIA
jgi:gamma-glutamyltranspeptidase